MKKIILYIKALRFGLLFSLIFSSLLLVQGVSYAGSGLAVSVNASTGGILAQGDTLKWTITGLTPGETVTNQIWIDVDANGGIDPAVDILFVAFSETDGVQSNKGPSDIDGLVNGSVSTILNGLNFPVDHYIFVTKTSTDSAESSFVITPMQNSTFTVSGTVSKAGIGMQNIVVRALYDSAQYYALTNASGNYTIVTSIVSGANVSVEIPTDGSFNGTVLNGYVVSPNKISGVLTTNATEINFVVTSGKVITGTVLDNNNNPVQGIIVIANHANNNNNNNYNVQTDGNGVYAVSVDTGSYFVQFGDNNTPLGYLITYYNQKGINWKGDTVHVTTLTDTVRNINATLYHGALITGTITNNGVAVQGGITASSYNASSDPLYQSWYDTSSRHYYLFVLPGVYTISFNMNNNSTNYYYNQTTSWPGTAVTVNSTTDTIKNINVDFSTIVPVVFSSINVANQAMGVKVDWTVATEVNEKQYIIERSTNGTDFIAISSKDAIGERVYSILDPSPVIGVNIYRIKAIDCNGASTYSPIGMVEVNKIVSGISVSPNPVINKSATVQLTGFDKGRYSFMVLNSLGQIVQIKEITITEPVTLVPIHLLQRGCFSLIISSATIKLVKTVLVQ